MPYPKTEIKHYATNISSVAFSTTAQFTQLVAGITQGSGVSNRIGNEIVVKSIQIRGHCTASLTTVLNHNRLIILVDKQPNGATPAFTDIYNTASCDSLPRVDIQDRFYILKEYYFPLEGYATGTLTAGGVASSYLIDDVIPCYVPIVYGASTGGVADLKSGNILAVQIADTAAAATNSTAVLNLQIDYFDN